MYMLALFCLFFYIIFSIIKKAFFFCLHVFILYFYPPFILCYVYVLLPIAFSFLKLFCFFSSLSSSSSHFISSIVLPSLHWVIIFLCGLPSQVNYFIVLLIYRIIFGKICYLFYRNIFFFPGHYFSSGRLYWPFPPLFSSIFVLILW